MSEVNKKNIQSIERAVSVLRCFVGNKELGLTEISNMINQHKSTTAGIVNTLKNEKLLEQNPNNSKFRLGIELFYLSSNMRIDLKDILDNYLSELYDLTEETINLVLLDGDNIIYVDKKESPHSIKIATRIGLKIPIYNAAVGKAMLSHLEEEKIHEILDNAKFSEFTPNTPLTKEAILSQIEGIRKNGYALDREEFKKGLISVAVPVLNSKGEPLGGICVSGPSIRMNEEKISFIKDALLNIIQQLSENENL